MENKIILTYSEDQKGSILKACEWMLNNSNSHGMVSDMARMIKLQVKENATNK